MRQWRVRAAAAASLITAAVLAMSAAAAQAAAPRQTGTLTFTSNVPGAPSGTVASFEFQNPDDPSLKPYSVANMIIHIPSGTVIDTTVPPQCHATDAEIYVAGPDACPDDTRIGSGYAVTDNGGGSTSTTDLTHFNNQDEVVGIGVNEQIPVIKTIDRTKYRDGTSTSTFPLFPGVPPPEPYTPVKTLYVKIDPYQRPDGAAYTRTPPTCPDAGYWTFIVDFVYRDGVTQSVESHSSCDRGRPR